MDNASAAADPGGTPAVARPVGSVRAALLVVEGLWAWYRRNWRATVVSSVVQPVLYLLALGFGFGSQVRPGEATQGLPYLAYLAPALLVAGAVQNAAGESTHPVLSSFKWARTYWGIIATPISPGQLVAGQLLWIALRLLTSGAAYLVVAALFGALTGPGVLLSLVFAVLAGMAFSAPLVAYSASVRDEGQGFNAVFRFVVVPMTLFAGTYFPVSQLPVWVWPLAWVTPLWHGTELARAAAFESMSPLPTLGHLAYLLAVLAVGVLLTRRQFTRRLLV
ncbi:ABC transporter permease [Goodfellowiella coeruleoviolacea]|uniref:Transport permease protein n=1 Tax=Goodfellowiella coeruleoviolacea TaxID=334858 RepID=A0AAE3KFM3_9PSEU|nr:ABC transporter permease [Goodfellowiella coeruleoviolacea]MCP2165110.1 lipooligosaccharide transport system permease protein [Goodfellowiella coeruleoviolacea]